MREQMSNFAISITKVQNGFVVSNGNNPNNPDDFYVAKTLDESIEILKKAYYKDKTTIKIIGIKNTIPYNDYDCVREVPTSKINLIKGLRAVLGCGLKEAKELVEMSFYHRDEVGFNEFVYQRIIPNERLKPISISLKDRDGNGVDYEKSVKILKESGFIVEEN